MTRGIVIPGKENRESGQSRKKDGVEFPDNCKNIVNVLDKQLDKCYLISCLFSLKLCPVKNNRIKVRNIEYGKVDCF